MEQLIRLVAENANISEAQAKTAVKTIVAYLKEKLPAPLYMLVENVLKGSKSPALAAELVQGFGHDSAPSGDSNETYLIDIPG